MKIFTILPAMALLGWYGCSEQPTESKSKDGLKTVSIQSQKTFSGNLNDYFPEAVVKKLTATLKRPAGGNAPLAKPNALISFDEAKFMVLWWDFEKLIENPDYYDDYANICEQDMAAAEAFSGKDILDFEDLVKGYSAYPYMSLASSGKLSKSGDGKHVEGDISVKPGINNALVCFIKNGKVTWASAGLYLYISGLYGGMMSEEGGISDGWLQTYNPMLGDSTAFWGWQIELFPDENLYDYGSDPWAYKDTLSYNFEYTEYPVFPFFGGGSDFRIGIPSSWIRAHSYYCNAPDPY